MTEILLSNVSMSFQLINESYNNVHYFEEMVQNNLCKSIHFICQDTNITNTMNLIERESSKFSIMNRNHFVPTSIIMGYLDLIEWVTLKKIRIDTVKCFK